MYEDFRRMARDMEARFGPLRRFDLDDDARAWVEATRIWVAGAGLPLPVQE